jgi:hypothetical protein
MPKTPASPEETAAWLNELCPDLVLTESRAAPTVVQPRVVVERPSQPDVGSEEEDLTVAQVKKQADGESA